MSWRFGVLLAAIVMLALGAISGYQIQARAGECPFGQVAVLNPTVGEITCVAAESRSDGFDNGGASDRGEDGQSGSRDENHGNADPDALRRGGVKDSVEFMCREFGICLEDDAWKGSSCSLDPSAPYGTGRGLPGERCPTFVQPDDEEDPGGEEGPPITSPEQAADQVIAKLRFTAAAPQVGPNRNDHDFPFDTAVGYPVWLWTTGGTASDSVTETVGLLTVSINIRLDKVIWDLGDGTTLRCDKGSKWRSGAAPGKKSPSCGHVYEKPGKYSIEATSYWTITWTAGGQSGATPYSITADRPFEVGEIHVLVR